jgi:hydrogenase expression/formation protein HypD
MGAEEWRFVSRRHHIASAVAGFTAASLLAALHAVLQQILDAKPSLENCYPEYVKPAGNTRARQCIGDVFDDFDANWRGIGTIPESGFALKPFLAAHDARQNFPATVRVAKSRVGDMPPGCDCAGVVTGRVRPVDCRLYGKACTPRTPVGPCMVSDEGACNIWWASGQRGQPVHAA